MFLNNLRVFYFLCILLIFLQCSGCWKNEKTYDQIALDFRLAFPSEMKEFRQNLSSSERVILQEVESQQKKYKNVDELIADIKNASPAFEEKFKKLYSDLQQRMNKLSLESLTFIYDVGQKVQYLFESQNNISKDNPSEELRKDYITTYQNLSKGTKKNLKSVLPMYDHLYNLMLKFN
uniref:Lipoprotein n=1 Tax=Strongyloides venezuelensis TaxID=75913 RepID=A0A0K0F0S9_STRVS